MPAIALAACTGSFEKYNTDQSGFDDDKKKQDYNYYGIPLGIVQQGIYFNYDWGSGKNWPFQVMQNLGADMFCGYMHDHKNFNGGHNNSTYHMMDGWNGGFWDNTYGYIMPEVQKAEMRNEVENPGFLGIAKILKVELMHRVTDIYGPIIYTRFGSGLNSMPDTQQEAYMAFFADLDQALEKIELHTTELEGIENFEKFDILMPVGRKTYRQWTKFANSLRLRLAMRLAMADPETAAAQVRRAMEHPAGLLEDAEDVVAVSTSSGYGNPLGEINKGWNEVYLNANMESIMGGFADPRLERYFTPAEALDDNDVEIIGVLPYKDTYKGIRQGTGFNHLRYRGHSQAGITQTTDALLMTAAEVWFLRAEAALRGWTTELPAHCYEQGVRTSFNQWRVLGADEYLGSHATPKDYVDALDPANDITARSTVTPCWDDASTNEQKLERIIVQKWIATFPEGCEAWAEQRRTGYPRLFPVLVNDSHLIDTDKGPRRLNFSVSLITANPAQYQALVSALGGADNCATPLWWDTGKNF